MDCMTWKSCINVQLIEFKIRYVLLYNKHDVCWLRSHIQPQQQPTTLPWKTIKLNNETEEKDSIMKISAQSTENNKKKYFVKDTFFANKFLTFLTHSILLSSSRQWLPVNCHSIIHWRSNTLLSGTTPTSQYTEQNYHYIAQFTIFDMIKYRVKKNTQKLIKRLFNPNSIAR